LIGHDDVHDLITLADTHRHSRTEAHNDEEPADDGGIDDRSSLVSEVSESELVGRLRAANTRLRELLAVKDAELQAVLTAKDRETAELREALRVLTLRVAELERGAAAQARRDPAVLPAHHPPLQAGRQARPRRPAALGLEGHHGVG
jgi:hypothetical protein